METMSGLPDWISHNAGGILVRMGSANKQPVNKVLRTTMTEIYPVF